MYKNPTERSRNCTRGKVVVAEFAGPSLANTKGLKGGDLDFLLLIVKADAKFVKERFHPKDVDSDTQA